MKNVLIGMAVFSTEENKKDECLERTLESLSKTVDFNVHKLMLSVNGFTERTKNIIERYENLGVIDLTIWNPENLGTARAINAVWKKRQAGQHVCKIDDDIVITESGWIEKLVECIEREPRIGQIGLKRNDCMETTWHTDTQYRSELIMIPHEPGQRWLTVEKVKHVMGSCVLHSSALIDKVGGLFQYQKYGFDDVIMSYRSEIAGFWNCHFSSVMIHHIDGGDTDFQKWKEKTASEGFVQMHSLIHRMIRGEESIYKPFE